MANNNDLTPSGAYFLGSALTLIMSGITGLVGHYQRQQLKALENAFVVKVRTCFPFFLYLMCSVYAVEAAFLAF